MFLWDVKLPNSYEPSCRPTTLSSSALSVSKECHGSDSNCQQYRHPVCHESLQCIVDTFKDCELGGWQDDFVVKVTLFQSSPEARVPSPFAENLRLKVGSS